MADLDRETAFVSHPQHNSAPVAAGATVSVPAPAHVSALATYPPWPAEHDHGMRAKLDWVLPMLDTSCKRGWEAKSSLPARDKLRIGAVQRWRHSTDPLVARAQAVLQVPAARVWDIIRDGSRRKEVDGDMLAASCVAGAQQFGPFAPLPSSSPVYARV